MNAIEEGRNIWQNYNPERLYGQNVPAWKRQFLPNAKNVCVITPTGGLIVRLNLAVYTTGCLTEN
ncbi:MAG: hypothetical protein HZB37_02445 [Planctomycetes bacterium]|nr:hypothetical protein [Planctomycetota bacterium]